MEKDYFKQRKTSVIITIFLLLIGSIAYFTVAGMANSNGMTKSEKTDSALFRDIQLKAAYTPEGKIKVFALAQNNVIKNYRSSNGNNVPEYDSMVIGYDEAKMMIEEKLFSKPDDQLDDLFGIDTRVEGILDKTDTFADDFHFLSSEQFKQLNGDDSALSIHFKGDSPKLFYTYNRSNPSPLQIELSQGNMNLFYEHVNEGKVYYPVIIGSKEAKMMIEEGLFNSTGDIIEGFFGKNVIVVGIAKETGTALDMMHIVEPDFFELPIDPDNAVLL